MSKIDPSIFGMYDIRGIAGESLNEEKVELIGKGYGTYLRNNGTIEVVVGRDIRSSSPEYSKSIIKGLVSTGCKVIDIGICLSSTMYWARQKYNIDGGVMVTASHNPANYNGFKLCHGLNTISGKEIEKVRDIIEIGEFVSGDGAYEERININDEYLADISFKVVLSRKLKIVVDPANATTSLFVPKLLENMGCEVEVINKEIDPSFPSHQPDPVGLEFYAGLREKMLETKADIGVMFDGDGDRAGFIDEKGEIWLGDKIMMLLAREIVPKNPGRKLIVELKNSEAVIEEIERLGGIPIFGKTGHSLMDEKVYEEKAVLAAEMSCHYWVIDGWYQFDDAVYAMARVLRIVAESGKSFSELMEDLPNYPATPEYRVSVPKERKVEIVAEIVEYFKDKCDKYLDLDGIRGYKYDGWFLIRSSNTQPVISVRVEAKTQDGLEKVKNFVKEKLDSIEGVNLDWNRQYDLV